MRGFSKFSLICAVAAALLSANACRRYELYSGHPISFRAGSETTKAAYSGDNSGSRERIDWKAGDLIRVFCAQASTPEDKFADYEVTAGGIKVSGTSCTATINCTGEEGVCWAEGDVVHTFYGVFPAPASDGCSSDALGEGTFSGTVKSVQTPLKLESGSGATYTATADLTNEYMFSKVVTTQAASPDGEVMLSFVPSTTAIEFIIQNNQAGGGDLQIKNISLESENSSLSGLFSVDLENWSGTYPTWTAGEGAGKTVTVDFSSLTTDKYVTLKKGETLKFTFFLLSANDVDDLTFRIVKTGGARISTKLCLADGGKVSFPCHKKSYVKGILVPEGAQWYVKYDSGVESWNEQDGGNHGFSFYAGVEPFVTKWLDESEQDINMVTISNFCGTEGTAALAFTNIDAAENRSFTVKSYTTEGDTAIPAAWTLQYRIGDGDWTNATAGSKIDGWITFDKVSGEGGKSGESVSLTVDAPTEADATLYSEGSTTTALKAAEALGSESEPYDLSMHTTSGSLRSSGAVSANCYIISAPGWYAFPLVYGNAIVNGAANTQAYKPRTEDSEHVIGNFKSGLMKISTPYVNPSHVNIIWEDVPHYALISDDSSEFYMITASEATNRHLGLGGKCSYVVFHVSRESIAQGNVLISGNANPDLNVSTWNWHLWFTPHNTASAAFPGTSNAALPVNLGWVDEGTTSFYKRYAHKEISCRIVSSEAESSAFTLTRDGESTHISIYGGSSPKYQWGRPVPFIRSHNGGEFNSVIVSSRDNTFFSVQTYSSDISDGIFFPSRFYPASSSPYLWYSNSFDKQVAITDPETGDPTGEFETVSTRYRFANLWSANNSGYGPDADGYSTKPVKTVYDPCPPGFQVPQGNAFASFPSNKSGSFNKGYSITMANGTTCFFPAEGYRDGTSSSASLTSVGSLGTYWTAIPTEHYVSWDRGMVLRFDSSQVIANATSTNQMVHGHSIRPVAQ